MSKKAAVLLLFLTASSVGAALAAAPLVVDDRSSHKVQLALVDSKIAALNSAADTGNAAELSAELHRIERDGELDTGVREYLLEAGVIALSRTAPDDQARRTVAAYRSRPVTVFIRMHEEHSEAVVPLYDVAAAARFTERSWNISQAASLVQAELASGRWRPADFLTPAAGLSIEHWQVGSVKAFRETGIQTVAAYKTALISALQDGQPVSRLTMEIAVRTRDPVLFDALAEHADAALLLRTINIATAHLDRSDATAFLKRCAERPDVASAAVLQLGGIAADDPASRAWLLRRLGNADDGASAALALSRLSDRTVLDDARNVIEGDHPELSKLRAALVLRLSDLPAAAAVRRQLLASVTISERVRSALQ